MKKLLLFIHGLGGDKNTWGSFEDIIKQDTKLNGYHVVFYTYPTSLIRAKNITSIFSKLLSLIIPQSKLPKIQEIAGVLKTNIENSYSEYDVIFLITHSMGGLAAKRYLIDELKRYERKNLKVKKLLLYAVPNNGSDLAKIVKFYPHEQIAQIEKDSDFIESLNEDWKRLNLEDHVDTRYVIGTQDKVVDKQSSQMMWANKNLETLHKGHSSIVKPVDSDDLSYKVFRNFVLKDMEVKKVKNRSKDESSTSQNINITTNNTINQTNNVSSNDNSKVSTYTKVGVFATIIATVIAILSFTKDDSSGGGNTYDSFNNNQNSTIIIEKRGE